MSSPSKTAKVYLLTVRRLERTAGECLDRIREFRDAAEYGTGMKESEHITGCATRSRVEDNVVAMVDFESKAEKAMKTWEHYDRNRTIAELMILRIPRKLYQDVLRHYYINGMTWAEVAAKLERSERQVYYIHGWALQVLDRVNKRKTQDAEKQ